MDNMLPSPGFSIPSIGTPLHQPEEDQQILPSAVQQQQQQSTQQYQQMQQNLHTMNSGMGNNIMMLQAPQKTMHYAPAPTFAPPQSLMQPQTPASIYYLFVILNFVRKFFICIVKR